MKLQYIARFNGTTRVDFNFKSISFTDFFKQSLQKANLTLVELSVAHFRHKEDNKNVYSYLVQDQEKIATNLPIFVFDQKYSFGDRKGWDLEPMDLRFRDTITGQLLSQGEHPFTLIQVPNVVRCFKKDGFQIGGTYNSKINITLQNSYLFGFSRSKGTSPNESYFRTMLPENEREVKLFLTAYTNYLRGEGPTFPHVNDLLGKSFDETRDLLSLNHLVL